MALLEGWRTGKRTVTISVFVAAVAMLVAGIGIYYSARNTGAASIPRLSPLSALPVPETHFAQKPPIQQETPAVVQQHPPVAVLQPKATPSATRDRILRPPRSEIDEVIQSGKYSQMPRAEVVSQSTGSGPSQLSVVNQTIYTLTVTFYGSTERSVKITAGQSLGLDLAPGAYRVLGRTNNPTVLPFVGNQNYSAGTRYESTFYVNSQIVP